METKMNNQEVIKLLRNQKRECESVLRMILDDITKNVYTKQLEKYNVAIGALEKQIPKKPTQKQLNVSDDLIGLCPACNEMWVIEYKGYCANCGQKLDWD